MSVLSCVTILLTFIGMMISGLSVRISKGYDKPILALSITAIYFIVVFIVIGVIYFLKITY